MVLMQQNPALFAVPQQNFPAQLQKSPKEPTGQINQLEVQLSPSIGSSGLKGSNIGYSTTFVPPTPVLKSEAGDVRDKKEREEDESRREGEVACRSSESEEGSDNDRPEERKDNKLMRSMLLTVGRGEYCILAKDELGNPLAPFEYNGTDVKSLDPLALNPEDGQGDGKNPQKASALTLKLYQMATELCPKIEGPQEPAVGRFVLYQPEYYSCARHIKNGINRDLLSHWWKTILLHCPWLNPSITDRRIPRLVCWLTSKGCMCTYTYSGAASSPVLMPDWLEEIGRVVMQILGWDNIHPSPTCCNINLYRNGEDCVGWHADDENLFGGLVGNCMIISLSLGQTRTFQLRMKHHQDEYNPPVSIPLEHGDIITMEGLVQRWYQHRVPLEPHYENPRINLTFRWILNHHLMCPKSKQSHMAVQNSHAFVPSSLPSMMSEPIMVNSETQQKPKQNDDNDSCSAPDAPGAEEGGEEDVKPPVTDTDNPSDPPAYESSEEDDNFD